MKRRMSKREAAALVLSVMLIAAVFATGILDKQQVWSSMPMTYSGSKTAWSLEKGDAYGFVSDGPGYELAEGRYMLKWQIAGDGENRIHLQCSNEAMISPPVIVTRADQREGQAYFEIKDAAHNFSIRIEFVSGTWMEAGSLRLYSPFYTDHAWTFAFLTGMCWMAYIAWRCGMFAPEKRGRWVLIAAAVCFVSVPVFSENSLMGNDTAFHAARLANLAEALEKGQVPARVGGFSYNGYGAVTSVFYPDFPLYPYALMLLGGASMQYVINVYLISMHMLSAALCYLAAKRMFGESDTATCASILYICAQYRLRNAYVRFAIGEISAMAVLPLFFLGLWEVFFGEKRRWPILVLSAVLILWSHLLTTALCACLAFALGVLFLGRLLRERRMDAVIKACAITLLISLGTLIPMATCYLQGIRSLPMQPGIEGTALKMRQIFFSDGRFGVHLWLGLAAFICAGKGRGQERQWTLAAVLAAFGTAMALISTEVFPWSYAVKLTGGAIEILQFTQRLLMFGTLPLVLAGGYGLSRLLPGREVLAGMLTLTLSVVCAGPFLETTMKERSAFEFGLGAQTYMSYPEYQFEDSDLNQTRSRQPILGGDVQLTQYDKDGTHIEAQVSAQQGGEIAFPLFGFDGYAAELNAERVSWRRGENNRLTVDLPAGAQGMLKVWYEGEALWRICDAVSVCTAAVLMVYLWRRAKKKHAQA